ncbi:MAG: GAF domain-containing protein [Pseudonocardiaceae bacterium]
MEAFTTGRPVVVADLEVATRQTGWPVFAAAAVEAGARAVFAFPLQLGAIRIGVLAFYRVTPGPLSGSERSEALIAAERATLVLRRPPGGRSSPIWPASPRCTPCRCGCARRRSGR